MLLFPRLKKTRGKLSLTLFSLTLLLMLTAFQNCTMSACTNLIPRTINQSKVVGGNDEPYDGKLHFSRLVPGLTCSDQSMAIGSIVLHSSTATVITNGNSCNGLSEEISKSNLEFSVFSKKYIGYEFGIFMGLPASNANSNETTLTEAWCRAYNSERTKSTFEFVTEWQMEKNVALLSVMTQSHPDATTSISRRELDVDHVSYDTVEGTLKINFNQKIPGTKKVADVFYGRLDGHENQKMSVECLMGGQFDPLAPTFKFSSSQHKILAVGESISGFLPIVNKTTTQFLIDGALPAGLFFESATGAITGQATAAVARPQTPC